MHFYFDFSDILDHAFDINNMFIKKQLNELERKTLLIDSKKVFTQNSLAKKRSIKYQIKKIRKTFQNLDIQIIFPIKSFLNQKKDILRFQKIQLVEQKFLFLHYIDTIYYSTEQIQKFYKDFSYVHEHNSMKRCFIVLKNYKSLLSICSKYNIKTQRCKKLIDIELSNQQNKIKDKPLIWGNAILILQNIDQNNILQRFDQDYIYLYDYQKFIELLKLIYPENFKIYLYYTFIIYSTNFNEDDCLYYQSLICNTHNTYQNYLQVYNEKVIWLINTIRYLDKNYTEIIKKEISSTLCIQFNLNFALFKKKFKNYKQLFFEKSYTEQEQNNQDLIDEITFKAIQKFRDLNLIPFNLCEWSIQKQNLIINSHRIFIQSNEQNFIENVYNKIICKKIFKVMAQFIFKFIPKKIILKQLHGQIFIKVEKAQKLNIKIVPNLLKSKSTLKNTLEAINMIPNNKYQSEQQNINFEFLLHCSFAHFYHQIEFVDLFQDKKSHYFTFLYDFSHLGYAEEAVLLIRFLEFGFFDKKAFLQYQIPFNLTPQPSEKYYKQITNSQYQLFHSTNFCQPIFAVFDDVKQIFTNEDNKNRQSRDLFWQNIFNSQENKREVLYHEVFRITLYNIIVYIRDDQQLNDLELLQIWNTISKFIVYSYPQFHFITIIGFFIKCDRQKNLTIFSKDNKVQDSFETLRQQYFSLILTNLINCAQQYQFPLELISQNFFRIPFSKTYTYQASVNLKKIIVILWTINNLKITKIEIMQKFQDLILFYIESVSKNTNVLYEMQNFLENLTQSVNRNQNCFDDNFKMQLILSQKLIDQCIIWFEKFFNQFQYQ